ncbi:MAG: NUDIX domain-containing protein [Alphaproteobacteria bacterium]
MAAADYLLSARTPLLAQNGVAALLLLRDGRYVLQLRSAKPSIWYPGHWGLFGGAVDRGERPLAALRRELREELEYEPRAPEYFSRFDFDLSSVGQGKVSRTFFLVAVTQGEFRRFRLHEGDAVAAFRPAEVFDGRRLMPYDAYALWLHHARRRLQKAGPRRKESRP